MKLAGTNAEFIGNTTGNTTLLNSNSGTLNITNVVNS
jgi:hypothetical protein